MIRDSIGVNLSEDIMISLETQVILKSLMRTHRVKKTFKNHSLISSLNLCFKEEVSQLLNVTFSRNP